MIRQIGRRLVILLLTFTIEIIFAPKDSAFAGYTCPAASGYLQITDCDDGDGYCTYDTISIPTSCHHGWVTTGYSSYEYCSMGTRSSPNDPYKINKKKCSAWNKYGSGCNLQDDRIEQNCWSGSCTDVWSGSCSAECGGGLEYSDCGHSRKCNEQPCCEPVSPATPIAVGPIAPFTERTGSVTLEWTAVTVWNEECKKENGRGYQICVGPNSTDPCVGGVQKDVEGESTTSTTVTGLTSAINYWKVRAKNKADKYSSWTSPNSFCFYGSDSVNPYATEEWSSCNASTHLRSRTCVPGCDCDGLVLEEVCQGQIRGTLFDASYIDDCPTANESGYLTGIPSEAFVSGQTFSIGDRESTAPTGWNPTFSVTTTAEGNYHTDVYAPATYDYDFSGISGNYDTTVRPKLVCNNESDVFSEVPGNLSTCLIQPCSIVYGQSFGFWKIFGGWWQVVGGNVYGANGVQSFVPPMMTANPQVLMLPDANGRTGVLSYGLNTDLMLGTNPNAKVSSDSPREILSKYKGQRYDYSFYKTRMDVFASTEWDGGSIPYTDTEKGYQIFKHTGDVTLNFGGPTGTRKVILLVDGSVTIASDIEVPEGAFLAVIASGNISFNHDVKKAEGWFLAENINIPCKDTDAPMGECDKDDVQFVGEGSFVGWTNINLGRDQGLPNNQNPSELFIYRSDMFMNAPDPIKTYYKRFDTYVP